ncbi:hypothetical protein ACFYNY_20135 [Streptomyces sp. NPDC006530]|uniref:hypothetical protein n=1 Tax=Streptomyces sp. NPDC006530 TaxID=3364750 RepID=UPI0036765D8B
MNNRRRLSTGPTAAATDTDLTPAPRLLPSERGGRDSSHAARDDDRDVLLPAPSGRRVLDHGGGQDI